MAASRKTILEATGHEGRICVEFEKVGEDYSHAVWLVSDTNRIPIFRSFEQSSRPNLPCFTELHQQGKNLFLTGANGSCHWSMSVEVGDATLRGPGDLPDKEKFLFNKRYGLNAPHRNPNDPTFHFLYFDVACRLKEDVAGLGTVYAKSEAVEYVGDEHAKSGLIWQVAGNDKLTISIGANANRELLRFDPDPKCLIVREQDDQLRISSSESADRKYPATLQWKYGIWV